MTLRTLSFGEVDLGLWGSVWDLGAEGPGFTVLGGRGSAALSDPAARIELGDEELGTWWLSALDVELESVPEGPAATFDEGFDQLTRVRGRVRAAGTDHEIDCLGSRASRDGLDLSRFESVREAAAWFGPDLGLAVLAARPRGAAGHGDDLITASLFEHGHWLAVEEPRLSTTYAADGAPVRASIELWLEPEESDRADGGEEATEPPPRRAAGEAVGAVAGRSEQELDVHAALLRWHAQGREGDGVYVLARRR
ncbi:MAG TPA: hypothetical protein VGH93_02740 [Solirubrobacteraceae bacterium]